MRLPTPPPKYDVVIERRRNMTLQDADDQNRKTNTDVTVAMGQKLILYSPNGQAWNITVSNAGAITATAI